MRRIVMITDCVDVAFNEMCGAVHAEADRIGSVATVEPLVAVESFSETNAAFLTRLVAETYPAGTILFTLVSKSKDLEATHRVIWGETKSGHLFVGSNFGYYGWLARDLGVERVYELPDVPRSSFSGKTFIAPMAARLAAGWDAALAGYPVDPTEIHDIPMRAGTTVHVDSFGNVKVLRDTADLRPGSRLEILRNGHPLCQATFIDSQIYLQPDDGQVMVYQSTSFPDMADIAAVRGDFATRFGVAVGDEIDWRPVPTHTGPGGR
ncbi:SAM-dependent chlorinase/fluorinase [Kribbella sp. NPDC056345]|uniref:SAM-dependent chlorinase/fluorinase n=1 Tax=Kribbella sp. NPDC056345 TaxID=3345789 RepID=UPI0035D8A6A8